MQTNILCILDVDSNVFKLFVTPADCSPPGFSDHGILQARILEWIAIPFSRGTSQPRGWTLISCLTGRFSPIWATGKSKQIYTCWYIKGFCAVTKWDVVWECKTDLNVQKSNNAICHINRKKDKNHNILIKKQKISQTTRIRREVSNPQKKKKKLQKTYS